MLVSILLIFTVCLVDGEGGVILKVRKRGSNGGGEGEGEGESKTEEWESK